MASSSLCPAKTRTVMALLNSGKLTAPPWRILAALSADATTAGNSGRTRRGWMNRSSSVFARLRLLQLFQAIRFVDGKFTHRGPLELGKVGPRTNFLPYVMGQRSQISS